MASPPSTDFDRLIAGVARFLDAREIPYMLIGGQAVLIHGEPRFTQDVDVTLGVGPELAGEVLAAAGQLELRALPDDPEKFARETFVLPMAWSDTGLRVDFIFSTTPYEAQAIRRAERHPVGGAPVAFATAEDLILHKLFAGRPRDLEDAAGVARRKGPELDWDYLEEWARRFAEVPGREEMPEQVERLERIGLRDD